MFYYTSETIHEYLLSTKRELSNKRCHTTNGFIYMTVVSLQFTDPTIVARVFSHRTVPLYLQHSFHSIDKYSSGALHHKSTTRSTPTVWAPYYAPRRDKLPQKAIVSLVRVVTKANNSPWCFSPTGEQRGCVLTKSLVTRACLVALIVTIVAVW